MTQVRSGAVAMANDFEGTRKLTADEQDRLNAGIGSVGLSDEGPGMGGQWISSTTRHGECQRSYTTRTPSKPVGSCVECAELPSGSWMASQSLGEAATCTTQRQTQRARPDPSESRSRDVEYGPLTVVHQ
jgi:hypothetical protein